MPRMTDAPVFVVGIARSGTTLLSAMLSAHSRLDCGPESRFFARFRHLDQRARDRILDPLTWPRPAVDFIASLRNQGHPINELFDLTLPEIGTYLAGRQPSVAAMLASLTELHAHRAGKARWVEKTPRHLLMTGTLRELWPDARIVRIVRDPRDVALSLATTLGDLQLAAHAHGRVITRTGIHVQFGNQRRQRCRFVVADPQAESPRPQYAVRSG